MQFDVHAFPYPSQRQMITSARGMVCTTHPLAAQAGLDVLKQGGNAIDAAIATAINMTLLEPCSNGFGSDLFVQVYTGGKLYGLNASGPCPFSISAEAIQQRGFDEIPMTGLIPVNVPGAPAGWAQLHKRFGRLPFSSLFTRVIEYAKYGYPVSPVTARAWANAVTGYQKTLQGPEHEGFFETFSKDGRGPLAGEIWKFPDHAATYEELANTYCESLYQGELAKKVDAFMKKYGGFLSLEDLNAYQPEWVEPLHVRYRDVDVWEMPPNGHGMVALMALNLLNGMELTDRDDPKIFHKQIEAMKLAFADGMHYITDPRYMHVSPEILLSKAYTDERRKLIGETALFPTHGNPYSGGTIYLCTADGEGNMVSLIQSNYRGFGSGIVVPGTGISLNDRGFNFNMDPTHENCIEGGKRPYHTIIPGFLTKDGEPLGPFGVMGGFMQPQGHVQVVCNMVDFHLNPQQALDAPRWQWIQGKEIHVERDFPQNGIEELQRRGHEVKVLSSSATFGNGQIILRTGMGSLWGATEKRADGFAAPW